MFKRVETARIKKIQKEMRLHQIEQQIIRGAEPPPRRVPEFVGPGGGGEGGSADASGSPGGAGVVRLAYW